MKGFIEVTPQYYRRDIGKYVNSEYSCLINVKHIREIRKNMIYYISDNNTFVPCAETYEEIKEKIKEAVIE